MPNNLDQSFLNFWLKTLYRPMNTKLDIVLAKVDCDALSLLKEQVSIKERSLDDLTYLKLNIPDFIYQIRLNHKEIETAISVPETMASLTQIGVEISRLKASSEAQA